MVKVAIVCTTIYVPKALEAYMQNAQKHGHSDVFFVITGDKKTPAETKTFCAELGSRFPYPVTYLDVSDQLEYLKNYPELNENLPWNCIQRRNMSFLYAYEQGAEVMITIDDDNFITDSDTQDFIGEHLRIVKPQDIPVLTSDQGWFNVCDYLSEERNVPFYHRGYPMLQRWTKPTYKISEQVVPQAKLCVSAGMWLGDPDIDAMARLCLSLNATEYTRKTAYALSKDTWSPFNSQNTAVLREVIPGYFMSWCVGRYDDIWPSYVVMAIANHLGHLVSYGPPVVYQERNPHNYFVDFDNERMGMQLSDKFCATLREIKFVGNSYETCLSEVRQGLLEALPSLALKDHEKVFIEGFCKSIEVWEQTIARCHARLNVAK